MSCGWYRFCLLFTVPWVSLLCVIVVFPGHAHLLFIVFASMKKYNLNFTLVLAADVKVKNADNVFRPKSRAKD